MVRIASENWPRALLDGPASEGTIALRAAQEAKEMIVNHARVTFGKNFPRIIFLAQHGKQIIPVEADGMYIAIVNDADCMRPPQYGRYNKLILLPDGLYLFGASRGDIHNQIMIERPWLGSGISAVSACYLRYGELAMREISRLMSLRQ